MSLTHPWFPLVVALAVLIHRLTSGSVRRWALVLLSAGFVSTWGAGSVVAVLSVILISYIAVRFLRSSSAPSGAVMVMAAVSLVGVLALFRYHTQITAVLHSWGWVITVPGAVGVSYIVFQAISYVADVRRGQAGQLNFRDLALYYTFFPKFISGPIVRVHEMFSSGQGEDPDDVTFVMGLTRIFCGAVKKFAIADFLALELVDRVFGNPSLMSGPEAFLGAVGYTIQLYADFSGYTDMALGTAMLLGYRLPENFMRPFAAVDLSDFWRRWHITLSAWLRDYVYIPLGGSRVPSWRIHVNLLVTFLVAGIWHGSGWTFIVWGLMHGAGLVFERAAGIHGVHRRKLSLPVRITASGLTFLYVALAFVFFRADSVGAALHVLERIVTGPLTVDNIDWRIMAALVAGFSLQFVPGRIRESAVHFMAGLPWPVWTAAMLAGAAAVQYLSDISPRPFIYGGF